MALELKIEDEDLQSHNYDEISRFFSIEKQEEMKNRLCGKLATAYELGRLSTIFHGSMHVDPITFELLTDPVVAFGDGRTYNRSTIPKLINGKSPFTNEAIGSIIPNMYARELMDAYLLDFGIELDPVVPLDIFPDVTNKSVLSLPNSLRELYLWDNEITDVSGLRLPDSLPFRQELDLRNVSLCDGCVITR